MDHHDHAHHMGMDHGSMPGMAPARCNMNMLFTWSTENLCIVFRSWRITNTFTLFLSLFLIVVLCAGYEAVREVSRRYEASCTAKLQNIPSKLPPLPLCTIEEETVLVQTVDVRQCDAEEAIVAEGQDDKLKTIFLPLWHKGPGHEISESSSLLRLGNQVPQAQRSSEMVKAALYAVQVFYSFFIMLLFMTYNGWIMIAVAVGAFVGHMMFGINTSATKSVACH